MSVAIPGGLKFGLFVYLKSDDPQAPPEAWQPVMPDDVPMDLKDQQILGLMVANPDHVASPRGDHETFYRVIQLEDDVGEQA